MGMLTAQEYWGMASERMCGASKHWWMLVLFQNAWILARPAAFSFYFGEWFEIPQRPENEGQLW